MHALLDVILPVFLVIGFGYIAVWRGLFPESGVDALMKFSQHFAIPCLLFSAITNLDLSSSFDSRLTVVASINIHILTYFTPTMNAECRK